MEAFARSLWAVGMLIDLCNVCPRWYTAKSAADSLARNLAMTPMGCQLFL